MLDVYKSGRNKLTVNKNINFSALKELILINTIFLKLFFLRTSHIKASNKKFKAVTTKSE